MDESERDLLKTVGALGGTFLGALLVGIGRKWKRLMNGREDEEAHLREARIITREEWHNLRDSVHRAVWEIANFKIYLEKELGRMEQMAAKDHERIGNAHERIGNALAELSGLKERMEHIEEQLDRLSDRFQHGRPDLR